MTLKNATAVVVLCENLFGCGTDAVEKGVPLHKARAIEAGKLNKAMKRDPRKVTLDNLELAATYCFEKRIPIKSPYGLVYKIEEALALQATPELTSDLAESVQRALAWEADHHDSSSSAWSERLTRAHGDARASVLADWKEAGRG